MTNVSYDVYLSSRSSTAIVHFSRSSISESEPRAPKLPEKFRCRPTTDRGLPSEVRVVGPDSVTGCGEGGGEIRRVPGIDVRHALLCFRKPRGNKIGGDHGEVPGQATQDLLRVPRSETGPRAKLREVLSHLLERIFGDEEAHAGER